MSDELKQEPGGWGRSEAPSHSLPPRGRARVEAAPLTDSPWFWAAMFSVVALVALVAMSGKYGRRQANIERKYQARERIEWGEAGRGQKAAVSKEYSQPGETVIPLWPIAVSLGAVIAVSVTMLIRSQNRHRADAENAE